MALLPPHRPHHPPPGITTVPADLMGSCCHPAALSHPSPKEQAAAPGNYSLGLLIKRCPSRYLTAAPWPHLSSGARQRAHDAGLEGDAAERDCLGEVASILLR